MACEVMFSDCYKTKPASVAVSVKCNVRAEIVKAVAGRCQVSWGNQTSSAVVSLALWSLSRELIAMNITQSFFTLS